MSQLLLYLKSSIGRKKFMGITGLVWTGFVGGHMAGNMLMFLGPDAYNKYGHAITSGPFYYVIEAVLLLTILTHAFLGSRLTAENAAAKGSKYEGASLARGQKAPRLGSSQMIVTGLVLAIFLVHHLLTFRFGPHYDTTVDGVVMRDLHRLMVEVFSSPWYVIWYVLAMGAVCLHLVHGFWSSLQSLGVSHPIFTENLKCAGWVYGVIVATGFAAQPVYVFLFSR